MTLRMRHALFAAYAAGAVLLHLPTLQNLLELARTDPSASHLLLIPVLSLGLLCRDWQRIFVETRAGWIPGGVLILVGTGVGVASHILASDLGVELTRSVSALSLVLLWAGGFLAIYGPRSARAAAFPLAFLLFAIPIPPSILQALIAMLREGTTVAVAALFTLTGTVFRQQGAVFELPTLAIEVADECSGIRSTIALVLTSILGGRVWLDKTGSRLMLLLAVFPVTVFKNAVRIVVLSLLSIHVDPSFIEGQLHRDGGVVFFLFSLLLLAPVLALLRRLERARPGAVPQIHSAAAQ